MAQADSFQDIETSGGILDKPQNLPGAGASKSYPPNHQELARHLFSTLASPFLFGFMHCARPQRNCSNIRVPPKPWPLWPARSLDVKHKQTTHALPDS